MSVLYTSSIDGTFGSGQLQVTELIIYFYSHNSIHDLAERKRWLKSTSCASTRNYVLSALLRCSFARLRGVSTVKAFSKQSTPPASFCQNLSLLAGKITESYFLSSLYRNLKDFTTSFYLFSKHLSVHGGLSVLSCSGLLLKGMELSGRSVYEFKLFS